MTSLFIILIATGIAAFVFLPLFRSDSALVLTAPSARSAQRRRLREEKANLILALRELDFDYETKKLSSADYKMMREKYEAKAVHVLKSLEELDRQWEEVQALVSKEIEKQLGTTAQAPAAYCAHCGKPMAAESRFCAFCGKGRQKETPALAWAVVLIFASAWPSHATAAEYGQMKGKVIEKIEGKEKALGGVTVRLSIVRDGRDIAGAETKTDANGIYRFNHLDTDPSLRYVPRAERNGVPFSGTVARFSKGTPLNLSPILVLPTIGDPRNLTANEMILMEFGHGRMKITHSFRVLNQGELAYDPREKGGKAIEWSLPPGGTDLDFHNALDDKTVEIDSAANLLRIRRPISPGERNAVLMEFSYVLQAEKRKTPFSLPSNILRDRVTLLLREKDFPVRSSQLTKQNPQTIDGSLYQMYTGGPFLSGDPLVFTLTGAWTPKEIAQNLLFAGLGIVLLAGGILGFRARKPLQANSKSLQKTCLDTLVDLERKFRSGRISISDYRSERERWMDNLWDLQP